MKRYPAILSKLYNTPHCIHPDKLEEICAFIEALHAGTPRDPKVAEAPIGYCLTASGDQLALDQVKASAAGGDAFVAVLPLFGTMMQHGGLEMEFSGGTSTEQFGDQFIRLANNAAIKTIVIECHSPGGQVFGTGELSDLIWAVRQRGGVRIVTAVNSQMASGALWVATAAHEVFITPGGEGGSVGVVVIHQDFSKAAEMAGVKTTLIATPEKKVAGNPFEPLGEETAAAMLANCEKTLGRFVGALSRNRKLDQAKVRSDFGGGGMLRADEAVKAGMCDGVATMRDVLAGELERLKPPAVRGSAAANARAIALAEAEQLGDSFDGAQGGA